MFHYKPLQNFTTPFIYYLFNILFTSYSFTLSTFTSFTSSTFCPSTYSLYYTIQLTFTTRWILIDIGSCNLTVLVDTTLLIMYGLTYWSTNFLASHFLNIKSFILNIPLSSFFYSLTSFLPLSACCFIFFCTFLNTASAFSYTFFILSTNSVTFSIFLFFLISTSILSSLL